MVRPPPQLESQLSYLVGPGPTVERSPIALRIGLTNATEGVRAVHLRLTLVPCEAPAQPLAQAEIGVLLPRRSARELAASIDWDGERLVLEQRSVSFRARSAVAGRRHLVRAELHDGTGRAPATLEVGVSSAARGDARPVERA